MTAHDPDRALRPDAKFGAFQRAGGWLCLLDDLDSIPVGVFDEAQARTALAHRMRWLLGPDVTLCQSREHCVRIGGGNRDVAVAGADLIGVDAEVVSQL